MSLLISSGADITAKEDVNYTTLKSNICILVADLYILISIHMLFACIQRVIIIHTFYNVEYICVVVFVYVLFLCVACVVAWLHCSPPGCSSW